MSNDIYNIKELNLELLRPNARSMNPTDTMGGGRYIVIGKPGTGKSFLMSDLIYKKSHLIPVGLVFSGTEDSNHMYGKMIPELFIYDSLDLDQLELFEKRQKHALTYLDNPWALLVIDDCFDDPKLFKKKIIASLLKNGRHRKMFMVIGIQYCIDFPCSLRPCVDGVFILRENSRAVRNKLFENFGGVIPDFTTFCAMLDTITDDNTALYINNAGTSNKLEDNVFWYKAAPVPKFFKFGSKEYWKYQSNRVEETNSKSFKKINI
jgi:hypothetical protein